MRGLSGETAGGNFYEKVGGKETFKKIANKFYEGVASDPVLRPMYPEEDLKPAAERLQLFLEQYWGGPSEYQELRGHPRLRMRHMPFKINPEAREHWLMHMRSAVESISLPPLLEAELWAYLDRAATAMLNTFED
ncbi:MAG: globin [Actinobacteria bacterium]|nr:globin [Actinomycetota bacterium]